MQWSKTKTYIIIALIFTNLILLYSVYTKKTSLRDDFGKESMKNLYALLEGMGVQSEAPLSTKREKKPAIEVEYVSMEDESFEKIYKKYPNTTKLIDELYLEISLPEGLDTYDYTHMQAYSQKFLQENFDKKDYRLKEVYEEEGILLYEQIYEDMFLGQAYVKFIFNPNNSIDISIFRVQFVSRTDKTMKLISSAKAVSKVISKLNKGDIIEAVDLGYYSRGEIAMEDSKQLAKKIKLFPFWRIKLKSGMYIYTEAI